MEWTFDRPTTAGWYWRQNIGDDEFDMQAPEVVYVRSDENFNNGKLSVVTYDQGILREANEQWFLLESHSELFRWSNSIVEYPKQ